MVEVTECLSAGRHKAVLDRHLDPSRRIAPNAQGLVVDHLVAVRRVVLEHGEDDAQHLVRQRNDGFFMSLRILSAANLSFRAQRLRAAA